MLANSRSLETKSYSDSYSYTSLRPLRPNVYHRLRTWLHFVFCYFCNLYSTTINQFRRPLSPPHLNASQTANCSYFESLPQQEEALAEPTPQTSSLKIWARIRARISELLTHLSHGCHQLRMNLAKALQSIQILKGLQFISAVASCSRNSWMRQFSISFVLTGAFVAVLLLWALFVFELPRTIIIILPIIILGVC